MPLECIFNFEAGEKRNLQNSEVNNRKKKQADLLDQLEKGLHHAGSRENARKVKLYELTRKRRIELQYKRYTKSWGSIIVNNCHGYNAFGTFS
jgi:hypothetical protein